MDKGVRESKTFVSTFRLAIKPRSGHLCVKEQNVNRVDTSDRKELGKSKLGIPSATDAKPASVPVAEAPQFKEPLQDCTVCEGSDATFQGVITGRHPVRVSWLHNGEKVHSSKTSFKNGDAKLTLTKCSSGDAGTYTCVAENTAGKQSSSAALHITASKETSRSRSEATHKAAPHENKQLCSATKEETGLREGKDKVSTGITDSHLQTKGSTSRGPPVEFLDPPELVEVRVGEEARIHCEFSSSSDPVASCWIYNRDKVVSGGKRVSVTGSKTQSTVVISKACPDDKGSYTIVVRNQRGSAHHTVSLSVIDRPDPPASHPVVSQLSAQSLVLSWTGPSYDGGTAVLGYIVELRQEGLNQSGTWTEVASRCKSTSHRVSSGLEPQGQYRFRVRAYNSAGVSEPSKESNCVKMATTKEQKEDPKSYVTVTIDTKNKVKDHYNKHEKLGVGKFGQVFRLSHKETGQVCAGKFYRARTSKERSAALKEIEIMNSLHHPKLVQCLAAYAARSETVMVMEYIAGGELFERIVDENFEHTELTSARYMQQILEGMQYVHKQNIVHLDLKPENIVCVDTAGTKIKIIDFGLASKLDGKPLMVMHGTPEFVAPEVISYEPVGLETDMWSIGVICFILLSGESPFQGNSDAETFALVTAAKYEFDPESFEDISDQAKDFISSLLKKDRRCRLSCTEALFHPWMASFTPLTRRSTKSLSKQKMRRFLAKRKWKKTGKAVLALQRMANLSNRPDSPGSSSEEPGWSQEAEEAIQSLDKQLQREPRFQQALKDTTLPRGATAQLTCLISGYPNVDVKWLQNEKEVSESSRVTMEQNEDGFCSLVLADLSPSDSGVYKCRASNKLGEAMCSAKLTVKM
ncbi:myosin light chain kinase, smooth muscle-like [Sphaeramia orbicularis]|uniref:Myosin light chain kinase, smooth muscle-like n=1 Tax=Sphaeramia orbicularis TaxID=375764 RepID=A0A672ZPC9_9TELE|nr:myosin light chain kinase, smooth muscle-like [Sphaeramia orbicularis]XP_029978369.1 myosin light chain kinase, smooth muscle-like [Sphaeramia orbicularis]XP_029978370.1 myosin light chain kinase, smooth muscle-like [Sphaeramia orbicularis]